MSFVKNYMKDFLNKLTGFFGGMLISKEIHSQILFQRSSAVTALLKNQPTILHDGVTGIIFSKDRAIQLFALLETMFLNVTSPPSIKVIYCASTKDQKNAYLEVESLCLKKQFDINFIQEVSSFKGTLLSVLRSVSTRTTFFLVDDILFVKPVSFDCLSSIDPLNYVLSLRLGKNLKKSYTTGRRETPPKFISSTMNSNLNEFEWFEKGNEWSDPWSVDGNFFSTKELILISELSNFSGPNTYEIALKTFNDFMSDRKGLCFETSRILNLPINKVQAEVDNKSGEISTQFLLEKWRLGLKIDIAPFFDFTPSAPHEEHPISFVRRLEA